MPSRTLLAKTGVAVALGVTAVLLGTYPAPANPDVPARPSTAIVGTDAATAIPGKYFVELVETGVLEEVGVAAMVDKLSTAYGAKVDHIYAHALHGFAGSMSREQAARLAKDPAVSGVWQDQLAAQGDEYQSPAPWHLDRIDQRDRPLDTRYGYDRSELGSTRPTVYLIDSGVRKSHGEFTSSPGSPVRDGWDFYDDDPVADDCNGHGTGVASALGGKTYGMVKTSTIQVVAVRVTGCNSLGTMSDIVAGIDWVTATASRPAVVNMSVGMLCNNVVCAPVADALRRAVVSGLPVVVTAGNNAVDDCAASATTIPEVIVVGASTLFDVRASFSNFGPCVDLFAPGSDMQVAWNQSDTDHVTHSGTSLAAPMVAGAAALILARPGHGNLTSAEVESVLENEASGVLGNTGPSTTAKLLFVKPPPEPLASSMAVSRLEDGRLDLFGINGAGEMFHRVQASVGSGTYGPWVRSRTAGLYSVSAEANGDGTTEQVVTSQSTDVIRDRRQARNNLDRWTIWHQLDGTLRATAVARNADGRLEMFGYNGAGQTWQRWQTSANSTTWTQWYGSGLTDARAIAADTRGDGNVHVFVIRKNGRIWHRTQSSSGWTAWVQLDGTDFESVAAAPNANGSLTVFATTASRRIFQRSISRSGTVIGSGWTVMPFGTGGRSVAAELDGQGQIQVFKTDAGGNIYRSVQASPNSTTYGSWVQMDGTLRP